MKLSYQAAKEYQKEVRALQKPVERAATATMKEAASIVKKVSMSALSSAGFKHDRRAMRSRVVPKKPSINCAAEFWLKPAYLNVFEKGATISGPLWVPLDGVPVGDRGRKLTPAQYIDRIGPLFTAKGADKPLLVGKGTRETIARATSKAVRFRKKAVTAGKLQGSTNVPLFVGVDSIRLSKRFNLASIVKSVGDRVGELYLKNIKKVANG